MELEELVNEITNYINRFSLNPDEFNEKMGRQHRTLQQSFTRLCFAWIEYVADENYPHDLRNQASHEIAKDMIKAYNIMMQRRHEVDINWQPSKSLPVI